MKALPRRRLGRSALTVTTLGFGAAPLGDLFSRLPEDQAQDTVVEALDQGISLIDVSPLYGHGLAEHRIGAALRSRPDNRPVISTKVGRVMDPFQGRGDGSGYSGGLPHAARFDYSADGARRSLEQSLLRLGTDRIDIALIHDVDVWTHGASAIETRIREALTGAYPALAKMRDEGTIGAIGIGVNEADICTLFARETDMDAVLLAGRYSLLEQPALETFFPIAMEKRIGVMLGGVFNSGILATGARENAHYNYKPAPPEIIKRVQALEAVCERYEVSLRVAALHFAAAHPAVSSIVLGAVSPTEISDNVQAMQRTVPADFWLELKRSALLNAEAPTPSGVQ